MPTLTPRTAAARTATRPPMRSDTRKLLLSGLLILAVGAGTAIAVPLFFGGYTHQGPVTNPGWLCLVIALGCCPTAVLTLGLALLKLSADKRRDPEGNLPPDPIS